MSLGVFGSSRSGARKTRRLGAPRALGVDANTFQNALMDSAGARGYGAVANCTTLAAVLNDIRVAGNMVTDADTIVDADGDAMKSVCASWSVPTTTVKTTTTSAGTSSKVPTTWTADTRVKTMQSLLNTDMQRRGCSTTLKTDGLIGKGTCGALKTASDAQQITQQPWALTAFWAQYGVDMLAGCKPYLPGTAPTCPTPRAPTAAPAAAVVAATVAPRTTTAPAANGADLMRQMQQALGRWLTSIGYAPIAVTGAWDPATCGAAILMDKTLANTDPNKAPVASLLAQIRPLLGMPCGTTMQPLSPSPSPSRPAAAPPPAAPPTVAAPSTASKTRSSSLPPLNRDGECVINFGQKFAEIQLLQKQLNATLSANGYAAIPVTGVWDAATCGAMFELRGKFDPKASSGCPNFYSVPLSCPSVAPPKKVTVAPPPVKQASMMLPLGLAAILGVGALVYAKKKGLIMAAKKAV